MARISVPSFEEWEAEDGNALATTSIDIDPATKTRFEATIRYYGLSNDSEVLVDKYTEAGTKEGEWRVMPPVGIKYPDKQKFDSVDIAIYGRDLLVSGVVHGIVTRKFRKVMSRIVGVLP